MNINPSNKDCSLPKGVMTEEYAINRTESLALRFDLKLEHLKV